MAGDVLVQTVLPAQLGRWVKQQADVEGLSTAAWLRRLIMQKQSELVVRAWAMHANYQKANSPDQLAELWRSKPDVFLERVGIHGDGTLEFRASNARGKPLLSKVLEEEDGDLRSQLRDGWLVLEGSNDPWTIVRKVADASADGQVILFLRADKVS